MLPSRIRGDLADVIKVKDLGRGNFPGLSRWIQSNHKNTLKRGTFPSYGHKEIGLQKKGQTGETMMTLKMEEGGMSQGMWVPLGAGKGRK